MKSNKYIILVLVVSGVVYYSSGLKSIQPVEELEILSGVGIDKLKSSDGSTIYAVPMSVYLIESDGTIGSEVRTGYGKTIGDTRGSRQRIEDKQNILGFEKVYLIGEEEARDTVYNYVEIIYRNPSVNDTGLVAVCKGRASDMLSLNMKGYACSADFIEGLLKNQNYNNFAPSNITMADFYMKFSAEGANNVIPYLEIQDNKVKMTGAAVFKKYKMIYKLNGGDTITANILGGTNGKGLITVAKNSKEYLNYYAGVKRKVKVQRVGERFKFIINIMLSGDIVSDTDTSYEAKFGKEYFQDSGKSEIEAVVKSQCEKFIKKMQRDIKVDCIGIGKYAAAKYGKNRGADWDKIVTEADIEVNVKAQIEKEGRANP